jgi:hypothetical protein
MSNQNICTLAALTALTATLLTPPAHAAGQSGMVVVRDPQTGELRAPTPAESNALLGQSAQQRKAPAQHVETVGPGGSRKVQLGKSALVYSVVTKNDDGTLTEQCVSGAHAAIAHPTPAKEPRHDSE